MSQMIFDQLDGPQGLAISINNVKCIGFISNMIKTTTTTAGATLTPDLSLGGSFRFSTNQTTVTIGNAINAPSPLANTAAGSTGIEWMILVENTNGASCTVTWGSAYRVGAATTTVTTNKICAVYFVFDGTSHMGVINNGI